MFSKRFLSYKSNVLSVFTKKNKLWIQDMAETIKIETYSMLASLTVYEIRNYLFIFENWLLFKLIVVHCFYYFSHRLRLGAQLFPSRYHTLKSVERILHNLIFQTFNFLRKILYFAFIHGLLFLINSVVGSSDLRLCCD